MKNKMRLCLWMVVCMGSLSLLSCSKLSSKNEILLGEYSSLTGTTATFGQSTHKGLQLAIDEINRSGGVLGKKLRVQTEDTQSKPEEAATAVNKLINLNHVVAVIGEVASSRSLVAAPICQTAGIPMISPASTNPEVTQKGDFIFRVCFIDPFQGSVLAKFAADSLHIKRVVILKDVKNDYSIGLAQFFRTQFLRLGGVIVGEQAYSEGDTDFKAQLTALKEKAPDAIFLPGYYTEAALIIKQARDLNIRVPIIGGDGLDSEKLAEVAGAQALENVYYSNHFTVQNQAPEVQKFVTAFQAKYHQKPDAMAALGYDAVYVTVDAIKRAGGTNPEKLKNALAATKGFLGVTGKISIDENRNAAKSVVILQYQNGVPMFKETINP